MGRIFIEYIEQADRGLTDPNARSATALQLAEEQANKAQRQDGQLIYTCRQCKIHLADNKFLISKVSRLAARNLINGVGRTSAAKQAPHTSSTKCKPVGAPPPSFFLTPSCRMQCECLRGPRE